MMFTSGRGRLAAITAALLCIAATVLKAVIAAPPATAPAPQLHVPPDFIVERVAGPPLIERPMMAGFDERGRLFVAESAGLNLDFQKLTANPPNFIRTLEDVDGDGRFDRSTIFADRMTFPSGALWHDGALYVASPPSVWKLEDSNDDGICDQRSEIVTGFGSTGNGADLHGPFLGPDGWLYFCDGRNGHDVTLGDGTRWKGKAAAVYRCRTDGSGLEVVFGGGMDNPVEAAFTPEGEMLVSCDLILARPQRQDGILYGIDGGVYPHDPSLSEFKRTGDLLKPVGDLGWVAVSGLTSYRGERLGGGFNANLFSAQFNTHGVQRHIVTRDGAGFSITSEDFLTCANPDFHPTDVLQDADGSLLVVDTGGWFRIGCPASQIAKPDIPGGIYRIRRSNAAPVDDPRGLKLEWEDVTSAKLIERLHDARPAVVDRAMATLATRHDAAEQLEERAVRHSGDLATRAIWTLSRRNTPAARASVRRAIHNADPAARRTAIRVAGLARDRDAVPSLIRSLPSRDLAESRNAALALGRIRDAAATRPLLHELKRASDPFHAHAVTYALIQTADPDGTLAGLADDSPAVRRGALIALDEMAESVLSFEQIVHLLGDGDTSVRRAAMGVVTARPQWATKIAGHVGAALRKSQSDAQEQRVLLEAIVAFARDVNVQSAVTNALGEIETPPETKALLLEALARAPSDVMPQGWEAALENALESGNEAIVRQAIETVRSRGMTEYDEQLTRISCDRNRSREMRVAALAAVARRTTPTADDFDFLLAQLDKDQPALARVSAAQCLASLALTDAQLTEIATRALVSANALEAAQLLAAFEKSNSRAVGIALVRSLQQSKAAASFPGAALRAALRNFPADVIEAAKPLLERVEIGSEQRKARLAELEPLVTAGGDPSRGQSVFFGKRSGCATCHSAGGIGGDVGPDLTKIGAIRAGRDLLESVIFPSASVARGFESYIVETTDGKIHAGTLARESADSLRLKTPLETIIPLSQIKLFRPDRVSIMPEGLDAQLSRQELADLLAFLQACK